jgi:hypothetical protein
MSESASSINILSKINTMRMANNTCSATTSTKAKDRYHNGREVLHFTTSGNMPAFDEEEV